jgi:hypothetical protein
METIVLAARWCNTWWEDEGSGTHGADYENAEGPTHHDEMRSVNQ